MLLRTPARIAIFGGGVGGGKSYAGLILGLIWRRIRGYRCGFFRIDRPRLTQEGGLWDTSKLIYPYFNAEPNSSALSWRFPSGAEIKLNGLQGERKLGAKDGGQIPLIQIDEAQEFSRKMFFYLLSRNRSGVAGIPNYLRAYCNPDPDGAPWLSEFLQYWWDPETGYPIPERSGVIRWFINHEHKFVWADTAQELRDMVPGCSPLSATFIKSHIYDNPILMQNNPEYLAALKNLDPLTMEIKLKGNFKIRIGAGSMFNRVHCPRVEFTPINAERVRYWDLAGISEEEAEAQGRDPDYTVGLKMARCNVTKQCFVEDVIRGRFHPLEVRQLIKDTADDDGEYVRIRIEFEAGSHTKYVEAQFLELLAGYDVEFVPARRSKFARAQGVSAQWKARNVAVKRAPWNEELFQELEAFPKKGRNIHDDQVDCLSGAFNTLSVIDGPTSDSDAEVYARALSSGLANVPGAGRYGR